MRLEKSFIPDPNKLPEKTDKELPVFNAEQNNHVDYNNLVSEADIEAIKKEDSLELAKVRSSLNKAALGLGLVAITANQVESSNVQPKGQLDNGVKIEQVTSPIEPKPESTVAWSEAERISKDLKAEINSPITQESTKVVLPEFKHINKSEEEYFNPPIEKGITSGDKQLDFLYYNQWLMKIPGIRQIIAKKAKALAEVSHMSDGLTTKEMLEIKDKNPEIKYTGGISSKNFKGVNLLDEFFKENKSLKKSIYKPVSDYLEFLPSYSVKRDLPKEEITQLIKSYISHAIPFREVQKKYKDKPQEFMDSKVDSVKNSFMTDKNPIFGEENNGSFSDFLGVDLSAHKIGMAWDKQINLPYISISDAWDFEQKTYGQRWGSSDDLAGKGEKFKPQTIKGALLNKIGYPFKIYDRFYLNPQTKEYISDDEITKMKQELVVTEEAENARKVADNTASYFGLQK